MNTQNGQNRHGSRPASQQGQNGRHHINHVSRAPAPMQQFPRAIQPALAVQREDQCQIVTRKNSTFAIMPVIKGHGIAIAQVLVVRHREGDVSILGACFPNGMALRGATGVEMELFNNLRGGEHYERVAVYKTWGGVCFQRWGFRNLNERVGQITAYFPDIRRASTSVLNGLSQFSGLSFRLNAQIVWKEYRKIEDTTYEGQNWAAGQLNEFNRQSMEKMNQTIREFADVAWGTELAVARQIMAMQLASQGDPQFDKTSPCLGQAEDVDVARVDPSAIEVTGSEIVAAAPSSIEVLEVVHA